MSKDDDLSPAIKILILAACWGVGVGLLRYIYLSSIVNKLNNGEVAREVLYWFVGGAGFVLCLAILFEVVYFVATGGLRTLVRTRGARLATLLVVVVLSLGSFLTVRALADPLQLAKDTARSLESQEAGRKQLEEELRGTLDKMNQPLRQDEDHNKGIASMKAKVRDLVERVELLINVFQRFGSTSASLRKCYRIAPGLFREAAAQWRKYAKQSSYEEYRKDYISVAEMWEALAIYSEGRHEELAKVDGVAQDLLGYLCEGRLFLTRFDDFLKSYPIDLESAELRTHFLHELQVFLKKYEELRAEVRQFGSTMRVKPFKGIPDQLRDASSEGKESTPKK